ncbi:MAG: TatD family hydrolase [Coriobacteriia bacterium]|nr:TatD family hydrolase [Coriobacteriia bacterium]MBN2823195.1 TatD family hydrolase [Coriobacteriia bacterium]
MAQQQPALVDLGAPCVDAHAHLDMLDDPVDALVQAALVGIELIVTIADVTEDASRTFDSHKEWSARAAEELAARGSERPVPLIRITVGVHPHNAKDFEDTAMGRLRVLSACPHVGAIGEMGLDYHYDNSPREDQRRVFRRSLELARTTGLAAVVHLREAHEEGLQILQEVGLPDKGCVIHCFTEGPEFARRFLDLGCYISFAGPATFKKAENIREAIRVVPLERLLVETDSPFLAPEPYRGRKNQPAFTVVTAARVAEVKGVGPADVAAAALRNARRVFGGTE